MNRKRQSVNAVIRNRTLDTKYLKLKDVARFSSAKTTDICLESYISTENMIPFLGGVSTASSVPDVKSASFYEEGDILLSNIRLYFCKIWKADKKGACSNDVLVVKPKNNIDPTFLYYCLCDKNFFNYADLTSKGTKMPRGTKSAIMKYLVPNIPLCTQNMIASILSNYDKLIQNYKKQIEDLQHLASELYKEWFVRFRFPGYEKASFENGIPVGWKYITLKELANVEMGQSPESCFYNRDKVGLPFHQGVGNYGALYLKDEVYSSEGTRIAKSGSIIFSVRAPVGKINITLNKIILGRGVAGINSKEGKNGFLLWSLKSKFSKEDLIGNGSIFASVTKVELLKQKILIPSRDILNEYDEFASDIEKRSRTLYLQVLNLSKQRDLLLPRLMSGKLEEK